jgi:hypothetical protein
MITNRRAALEARARTQAAASGYMYTRVAIGPAVESSIEGLEWSFWQYYGVEECSSVPAITASDDAMFSFLDEIDPIHESDDVEIAFFEAYYYQSYAQLGYPDDGTTYLKPYYLYGDADYAGALPTPRPAYDGGAAMHDIDTFVETAGDRLLFVYGQWDPWTGGAFSLGDATNSLELVQPEGTHGSSIMHLTTGDEEAALAALSAWTGVPAAPQPRVAPQRIPHVPHLVHALRARRQAP